jgi:DNA-binding winged helix-turn-helix (wHTH) protein
MSGRVRFAEFELDLAAYTLRSRGERVRLEKLPMEVLILLVRASGALVERGEIRAALWDSEVFIEHDAAINTAVRKIRQALGDDAEKPRFVETVVGKGYRFVAPVESPGFHGPRNAIAPVRSAEGRAFPRYSVTRGADEFILETGINVIGRDPSLAVCIEHPSVSRRHASISIDREEAVLEDLKSRNGTFLDGRRIVAPATLHQGAIIGLGAITLTFRVLSAPASTLPVNRD